MALQMGAEAALDPTKDDLAGAVAQLSDGRGADTVIVAVPSTEVVAGAFDLLRPAGRILLFAHTRLNDPMKVDAGAVCMLEKALIGSYSSDITLQDECAELIFTRKVDVRPLLTHRFELGRIAEAVDYASRPRDESLKILVTPTS
jgi:L-iditol 2-dehydrogenase